MKKPVFRWLSRLQRLCLLCQCPIAMPKNPHGYEGTCHTCFHKLMRNVSCCCRCALPLPRDQHGQTCGRCLQTPPPYQQACVPLLYHPDLSSFIFRLKKQDKAVGALASLLLSQVLSSQESAMDVIVPIPLHWQRDLQLGGNGNRMLSARLANTLGLKHLPHGLVRYKKTQAQKTLDYAQRKANVRGSFRVKQPVAGLHVVLVDDVITTQATMTEAAKTLLAEGAASVTAAALARTPFIAK